MLGLQFDVESPCQRRSSPDHAGSKPGWQRAFVKVSTRTPITHYLHSVFIISLKRANPQ